MSRFTGAALILTALLAPVALSAPAPAPAPAKPPAARPATRPDDAARKQKTIQALLLQADEALAAEDVKVARDTLLDLLILDAKNPRGLAGAGYTYLKL